MKPVLLAISFFVAAAVRPGAAESLRTVLNESFDGAAGPLNGQRGWVSRNDGVQTDGAGKAVLAGGADAYVKHPVEIPSDAAKVRLSAWIHAIGMPNSDGLTYHPAGKNPAWVALGLIADPNPERGLATARLSLVISADGQTFLIGLGQGVGRDPQPFGIHQTFGSGWCDVALEYDFRTQTAAAFLNGEKVLSGSVKLTPADFKMVGFQLRRIAATGGIGWIKVETMDDPIVGHASRTRERVSVPEPGLRINTEHERNRALVAKIDSAQTPAETLAALKEGWGNPPATYRPHTRWWWPGNAVTKEGLIWQLEQMHEQGFGGVEPMAFRKIYEKGNIEFDSEEFVEIMKHVVDECRRLGMYVTPPLFPGWGHGSSRVAPEHLSKAMVISGVDVDGGAFERIVPLPERGQTLEVTFRHYMVSQPKRLEAVVAVALDEKGIPDTSRRIDLTASISGDRGWSVAPKATVSGELPSGSWRLMAFWTSFTGQRSTAQTFEAESHIIDHLDRDAVESYLALQSSRFLEAFGADYGQTVDSYFGDSFEVYQYFSYWSEGLFERFEQMKGYDLKPFLPLLLYNGAPETRYIRYDMGHFLHRIGMESLVKPLAEHCEELGIHMRQQPHYRFVSDIIAQSGVYQRPETENTKTTFDPMFWHKLTTSGAWLYPSEEKKWVSAEAFTFINAKYRTSMEEIKRASDLFIRDGITQFYNHGYFYSPEMEIAPSRDLIWMNRISHVNTWWPWYRGLADYQARASFLSRQGHAQTDVLVYAPYPTMWSDRSDYPAGHARDLAFGHLPKTLVANGYDFDFANDDLLLNHAEVNNGKLVINGYEYSVLILPRVILLSPQTLEKIERFVQAGGTVFALNTLPEYSDGWKDYEARDVQLAAARDRLFNLHGGAKTVGQGKIWFMPDCDGFEYLERWHGHGATREPDPTPPLSPAYKAFFEALRSRLTPDFEMADKAQSDGLTFRRTVIGDVDCWFITNLQPHSRKTRITLKTKGKEPQIWDAMDGSVRGVESFSFAPDGRVMLDVDLEPWESKFVLLTPPGSVELPPVRERIASSDRHVSPVEGPWEVSFRGLGNLTADLTMDTLKDWRDLPGLKHFSGTATYSTEFQISNLQSAIGNLQSAMFLHLGEVKDVATVIVNGEEAGKVWMPPYRVDISKQVKPGANTLKVVVANRLWNHTSGLEEPKPIPEHLHAHYGYTWNQEYNGWNSMINQRRSGGLLPSGLLGPVRVERENQ